MKRYKVTLSYSSIDRLFYVRLYEHGVEVEEAYFQTKQEARDFMNKVTAV